MNDLNTRLLDPKNSWRNHQRIRFIKGFYITRKLVDDLFNNFERTGEISHEEIDFLLETHIRYLKDLSHILYRMPDDKAVDRKKQRIFDKVFGEMWHELDKARDNIRLIEAYSAHMAASNGEVTKQDKTLRAITRLDQEVLNAARRDLPFLLRRSKRIMETLVPLFEDILPVYQGNDVVLRSIYFAKDILDPLCYPSAIEYFYPILYGSTESGYFQLLESLISSKHTKHAEKVLLDYKAWMENNPQNRQSAELLASATNKLQAIKDELM